MSSLDFDYDELRDWLLGAGFRHVDFFDDEGRALTAHGRRLITVATA